MTFVVGRRVRQNVNQDEWLQWASVTGEHFAGASGGIDKEKVGITLELDHRTSPGPLCTPGDRVNILAELQVGSRPPRYYRVIRNISVLMTGTYVSPGMSGDGRSNASERRGARTYRSLAVQIDPAVSTMLLNVLGHARGPVQIEVLPPDAPYEREVDGKINPKEPELVRLAEGKTTKG